MLTNENYFSSENSMKYMSASQFKEFLNCEEEAYMNCIGKIEHEETDALLIGSYIDAHFSNEMDIFKAKHPNMYKRDGTLLQKFENANKIINRIEEDELMMKYLSGEHQKIMTGVINGVEFKIKMDSYFPGQVIVDQKIVKDFKLIWDEKDRTKKNFIDYWGYAIQGAIYQEIVRQNTGLRLPFVIAATTKEKSPDIGLFGIPQNVLDDSLDLVKKLAPRFAAIKKGEIKPKRCGECDYCKSVKKLTGVVNYHELDGSCDEDCDEEDE